uniref:RNA polymerase II elongation factor ELL n=1 Tax=Bactrocera dorsalis TaxID=27457 RepID=A0A034V4T3_BACDO
MTNSIATAKCPSALSSGNYGMSQNRYSDESKDYFFVKLTDSAYRAIEEYQHNENTKRFTNGQRPKIQVNGNSGVIYFPTLDSNEGRKFGFTIDDIEGSLECIQQTSEGLDVLGSIPYRMRIHANDDIYDTTRTKMAIAEETEKSKCIREIKPNQTDIGRKVKKSVPSSTVYPHLSHSGNNNGNNNNSSSNINKNVGVSDKFNVIKSEGIGPATVPAGSVSVPATAAAAAAAAITAAMTSATTSGSITSTPSATAPLTKAIKQELIDCTSGGASADDSNEPLSSIKKSSSTLTETTTNSELQVVEDEENVNLAQLSSIIRHTVKKEPLDSTDMAQSTNNPTTKFNSTNSAHVNVDEDDTLSTSLNQLPDVIRQQHRLTVQRNNQLKSEHNGVENGINILIDNDSTTQFDDNYDYIGSLSPTSSQRLDICNELLSEIRRDWLHFRPKTPTDELSDSGDCKMTPTEPLVEWTQQTPIAVEMLRLSCDNMESRKDKRAHKTNEQTLSNMWDTHSDDALFVSSSFKYAELEPDTQLLQTYYAPDVTRGSSKSPDVGAAGNSNSAIDFNLSGDSLTDINLLGDGDETDENMLVNILKECDDIKTLNQATNFWNGILEGEAEVDEVAADVETDLLDCIDDKTKIKARSSRAKSGGKWHSSCATYGGTSFHTTDISSTLPDDVFFQKVQPKAEPVDPSDIKTAATLPATDATVKTEPVDDVPPVPALASSGLVSTQQQATTSIASIPAQILQNTAANGVSFSSNSGGAANVASVPQFIANNVQPQLIATTGVVHQRQPQAQLHVQQQIVTQQQPQQQQQVTKEANNERNSNLEELSLRRLSNESVEIIEKPSPNEADKQKTIFDMSQNHSSSNNNNKSPTKMPVIVSALPPRSPVKKQQSIVTLSPTTPTTPITPTTPTTPITPTTDVDEGALLRMKTPLDASADTATLSAKKLSLQERKRLFMSEEKLKTDKRIEELRNERKKSITEEVYRKSFAKSEEKLETSEKAATDNVVMLRKKSFCATTQAGAPTNGNRDDATPELMKVFARRSLKIKDEDINALADKIQVSNGGSGSGSSAKKFVAAQQNVDSDKENQSASEEKLDKLPKLEASHEMQSGKLTNGVNNRNSLADFRTKSVNGSASHTNGLSVHNNNNNNNNNNSLNSPTSAVAANSTAVTSNNMTQISTPELSPSGYLSSSTSSNMLLRDNKRVSFHDEENNYTGGSQLYGASGTGSSSDMYATNVDNQMPLDLDAILEDRNHRARMFDNTVLEAMPTSPDSILWNTTVQSTPGVIGAQEVYRDPRQRRLAEKQQQQQQRSTEAVPEKLSFKEKMKMFALESGEDNTPKDKLKISRAQRDIDAVH